MEKDNTAPLEAKIEALLFIHGEPLTIRKIAGALKEKNDAVTAAIDRLKIRYESADRGIAVLQNGDAVGLVTKAHLGEFLRSFVREEFEENLSPAALETLTLILYLGPISRARIEFFRGVNSSFTLRNLLLRGLAERFPDPARNPGFLYRPSFDLLKYLGIGDLKELPGYEEFSARLAQELESSA